jgi:hypothetical protein
MTPEQREAMEQAQDEYRELIAAGMGPCPYCDGEDGGVCTLCNDYGLVWPDLDPNGDSPASGDELMGRVAS